MFPVRVYGWQLLVVLLLFPLSSFGEPKNITDGEVALLPAYCPDTQTFGRYTQSSPSPRTPYWLKLMGHGFWGMHHYCWALVSLARAEKNSTSEVNRRFLRRTALDDIDFSVRYGIEQSGLKFVLLPEMLVKRAQVLLFLRRDKEAVESFQKSIMTKQNYWPAYVGLAEYYKRRGNFDKAREYVEEGLSVAPDSKTLSALRADPQISSAKAPPPRKPESAQNKEPEKTEPQQQDPPPTN